MAKLNFNASEVAPATGNEPLPAGEYTMQIVNSDMRTTKSGTGEYLWLEFEVLGPTFKGRKFWDRLNLMNENTKTVEIAQRQLSAICHAVGVIAPKDSVELHNKPIRVKIKVTEGRDGSLQNGAVYLSSGGATSHAAPPAASMAPATGSPKPWERHKK